MGALLLVHNDMQQSLPENTDTHLYNLIKHCVDYSFTIFRTQFQLITQHHGKRFLRRVMVVIVLAIADRRGGGIAAEE